jgi:hypothetical protein
MSRNILIQIIVIIATMIVGGAFGQNAEFHFPKDEINKFNAEALQRVKIGEAATVTPNKINDIISSPGQLMQFKDQLPHFVDIPSYKNKSFINADTLFIGDTLEITGEWIQNGPIILYGSGWLHFTKAHATILGDIYLLNESQLQADSSSLYIPQAYFYQRAIIATGGSKVRYQNTTVDHSNLSHNIMLIDSAGLELINVVNKGFTTNGIYNSATVFVDGINQAGEYIIVDDAELEFHHAKTVLLWHQFPETAVVDFTSSMSRFRG